MLAFDQNALPTGMVDFSYTAAYPVPPIPDYRRPSSSFFLDPGIMLHQSLRGDEHRRDNRRIFHRKVRTGCATCKARHVKCDETKPECKRCTSRDLECPGYEEPKKDRKAATLLPRDTTNKDTDNESSRSSSTDAESSSSHAMTTASTSTATAATTASSMVAGVGPPPPPFFVTADPLEKHYLDMFLNDTFPSIWRVEIPHPERWINMVKQLIQEEPVVRHSAIALAAAHERQRLVVMRLRSDPSRYAMEYYNKAINQLLKTPPNDVSQRTRSTIALLTCCLMFVTIEMFLNRDGVVRTHLKSGVRILKQAQFAPFASEEEEILVANFEALDAHTLMYPGVGSSRYEADADGPLSDERPAGPWLPGLGPQPHVFHDADDAVHAYNRLCARLNRFRTALATDIPPPESELVAVQTDLLEDLSRWTRAYHAAAAHWPESSTYVTSTLALSVDVHTLWVRGALDATCMAYDEFSDDVAALIPRLEAALDARDPTATRFSVDTLANELVCIWFLTLIARAPPLRTRLRAVLRQALSRRGVWCGMAMTVVTDHIRTLEEAGTAPTSAADIPSHNRLRWVGIDVDNPARCVHVVFRRVGGAGVEQETLPLW